MTNLANQTEANGLATHRIMIVGRNVSTVQRVSRCFLKQGAETLPYYGLPPHEEVDLFNPDILIVCLPAAEDFLLKIDRPFVVWTEPQNQESEMPVLQLSSNCIDLENILQQAMLA